MQALAGEQNEQNEGDAVAAAKNLVRLNQPCGAILRAGHVEIDPVNNTSVKHADESHARQASLRRN